MNATSTPYVTQLFSRVSHTLAQILTDARGLTAGQAPLGLSLSEDGVDLLFRKLARGLDCLSDSLNDLTWRSVATKSADTQEALQDDLAVLDRLLDRPLGEAGRSLSQIGVKRARDGRWETDYLALDYQLRLSAAQMIQIVEAFLKDCLGPFLQERSPQVSPISPSASAGLLGQDGTSAPAAQAERVFSATRSNEVRHLAPAFRLSVLGRG